MQVRIVESATSLTIALAKLVHEVNDLEGDTFVHCANGHGRSSLVVAMVMIIRGVAPDIKSAYDLMRQHRPRVHYQPAQERSALDGLAAREKLLVGNTKAEGGRGIELVVQAPAQEGTAASSSGPLKAASASV